LQTIWRVADPLEVEKRHSRPWPDFINESMFDRIKKAHDVSSEFLYSNRKIQRLRGGPLIGEILRRMMQKRTSLTSAANEPKLDWIRDLRMYIYSAHDMTLLSTLENLGAAHVSEETRPGFASCILFELWQEDDKFYVRYSFETAPQVRISFESQWKGVQQWRSEMSIGYTVRPFEGSNSEGLVFRMQRKVFRCQWWHCTISQNTRNHFCCNVRDASTQLYIAEISMFSILEFCSPTKMALFLIQHTVQYFSISILYFILCFIYYFICRARFISSASFIHFIDDAQKFKLNCTKPKGGNFISIFVFLTTSRCCS